MGVAVHGAALDTASARASTVVDVEKSTKGLELIVPRPFRLAAWPGLDLGRESHKFGVVGERPLWCT
jgi:hypothetical protein